MKPQNNFSSHNQVFQMLFVTWKEKWELISLSVTLKESLLTKDGVEFLSYARQVVEQTNLLEERYKSHTETRELFSVSSQHYAFVVNAFVSLLKRADMTRYELFLRETRTYEIIEDVKNFRSEIGVLFLNSYNRDVLTKMFDDNRLTYTSLFKARPHIFVSKSNPWLSMKLFL